MLFIALDLDMLIAARTAPMQSYCNPAERVMATLNLALQNIALERKETSPEMEWKIKRCSTLKLLRQAASKQQNLQTEFETSVKHVIKQVEERFSRLKVSQKPVQVHQAAAKEQMEQMFSCIYIFWIMIKKNLQRKVSLQEKKLTIQAYLVSSRTTAGKDIYIYQVGLIS